MDTYNAPDCTLAIRLAVVWMLGEWLVGNISDEPIDAAFNHYLGQCG